MIPLLNPPEPPAGMPDLEDLHGRAEFQDPDPACYGPTQGFAASLRAGGAAGIAYSSVRQLGGACVAGFRPSLFSGCRHAKVVQFFWDGRQLFGPGGLLC